jgi:hypothetical protein
MADPRQLLERISSRNQPSPPPLGPPLAPLGSRPKVVTPLYQYNEGIPDQLGCGSPPLAQLEEGHSLDFLRMLVHSFYQAGGSGIRYPVCGIRYPVSGIQYPVLRLFGKKIRASGIRYPVSGIRYPVSGIRYPVSGIRYCVFLQKDSCLAFGIRYPVSGIRYPVSGIRYPVSGIRYIGVSQRGPLVEGLPEASISGYLVKSPGVYSMC